MALVYVGGNSNTGTGSSYTVSLTGLTGGASSSAATGDIVIVCTSFVSQSANPTITITGDSTGSYTQLGTRGHADDTWNTEFLVGYAVMGATPDTIVTAGRASSASFGGGTVVHVWRGQDTSTPIPQDSGTASIINSAYADPSAVTIDDWQVIISVGAGAQTTSGSAFTVPTEIPDNNISINGDGSTSDIGVFIGSAVFTGSNNDVGACSGGATSTSSSGCALSLGLRSGTKNYSLSCSAGSYSITGNASTFSYQHFLSATAGAYSVSGYTATLNRASSLSSAVGSYAITGNDATLTYTPGASGVNYTLTCDVGSYAITGNVATFDYDHFLSVSAGAYSVTGNDATLTLVQKVDYVLSGETGSYLLNGKQAILTYVTTEDISSRGLGGDDVPIRYEVWEKRKKAKKENTFDSILDEAIKEITRKQEPEDDDVDDLDDVIEEPNDVEEVPEPKEEPEESVDEILAGRFDEHVEKLEAERLEAIARKELEDDIPDDIPEEVRMLLMEEITLTLSVNRE